MRCLITTAYYEMTEAPSRLVNYKTIGKVIITFAFNININKYEISMLNYWFKYQCLMEYFLLLTFWGYNL